MGPRGTGREARTRDLDPPGWGKVRAGNVGVTLGVGFLRNEKMYKSQSRLENIPMGKGKIRCKQHWLKSKSSRVPQHILRQGSVVQD